MDIVWQYLSTMQALTPINKQSSVDLCFATRLLPHPWHLCKCYLMVTVLFQNLGYLAGDLVTTQMVKGMHSFLSTLYVILRADDVDIRLKCLCFRSWTFQLTMHEQVRVLHILSNRYFQNLLYILCKLLCSVGDVLADNSADSSLLMLDESLVPKTSYGRHPSGDPRLPIIKQMDNLSNMTTIEVSSQRNLVGCLTDGLSETFWECGEEDINHTSCITISWNIKQCSAALLGIFLDQIRDSSYRINQIIITPFGRGESKPLHSSMISPASYKRCSNCLHWSFYFRNSLDGFAVVSLDVRLFKLHSSLAEEIAASVK